MACVVIACSHFELTNLFASLRDKGAGQEADQADCSATDCSNSAAEDVGEDADNGRAEENHPHGERAHPRCKRHREKAREGESMRKSDITSCESERLSNHIQSRKLLETPNKTVYGKMVFNIIATDVDYKTKPNDAIIEHWYSCFHVHIHSRTQTHTVQSNCSGNQLPDMLHVMSFLS